MTLDKIGIDKPKASHRRFRLRCGKLDKTKIQKVRHGVKLIDNSINEYQLSTILKELLTNVSYSQISVATDYWDLPGMVERYLGLARFLERENTSFRLLLCEEPSIKSYQVKNPELVDPDFPQKYLKKYLRKSQTRFQHFRSKSISEFSTCEVLDFLVLKLKMQLASRFFGLCVTGLDKVCRKYR